MIYDANQAEHDASAYASHYVELSDFTRAICTDTGMHFPAICIRQLGQFMKLHQKCPRDGFIRSSCDPGGVAYFNGATAVAILLTHQSDKTLERHLRVDLGIASLVDQIIELERDVYNYSRTKSKQREEATDEELEISAMYRMVTLAYSVYVHRGISLRYLIEHRHPLTLSHAVPLAAWVFEIIILQALLKSPPERVKTYHEVRGQTMQMVHERENLRRQIAEKSLLDSC